MSNPHKPSRMIPVELGIADIFFLCAAASAVQVTMTPEIALEVYKRMGFFPLMQDGIENLRRRLGEAAVMLGWTPHEGDGPCEVCEAEADTEEQDAEAGEPEGEGGAG